MESEKKIDLTETTNQNEDIVEIDTFQIDRAIHSHGKYEFEDKYLIKSFNPTKPIDSFSETDKSSVLSESTNCNPSPNSNSQSQINEYIAKIKSSFKYTGILSNTLTKEKFGLNYYPQGDSYLGEWKNDVKEGVGMYVYTSSNEERVYIGNWKNGIKQGKGILYFVNRKEGQFIQSRPDNLDVYIGSFIDDKFSEGITFKQTFNDITNERERLVYIGKYNSNGEKNDSNGTIIQNNSFLFNCELNNESMNKGWIMNLKEGTKDQLSNIFFFEKTQENTFCTYEVQGITIEIDDHIKFKQKYDLEEMGKKIEEYHATVFKIKKEFENIDYYKLSNIDEAIKLFDDNQLSYDKIKKLNPLDTSFLSKYK